MGTKCDYCRQLIPFLERDRFFQLDKCPKSQNLKEAITLIKPSNRNHALQFVHALSWNSKTSLSTPQATTNIVLSILVPTNTRGISFPEADKKMLKASKTLP